jgi:EF-hand domain pair
MVITQNGSGWPPHTCSAAQIFNLVDTDSSGQISSLEVKHLMNLLGERVELAEVETLIAEFDIDGSGEVDLTELILVLALQRRTDYKKEGVLRRVPRPSPVLSQAAALALQCMRGGCKLKCVARMTAKAR